MLSIGYSKLINFFTFYNIALENRLQMASFYMKGEALNWYKWMFQNHQFTDWSSFARALELRFGPSTYENHQAQLFKLKQGGTVAEYQAAFEKIGNQVMGLPSDAMLNCFISGLIPEIRNELAILKPYNISQAIGLAKLIESKIKDSKPKFQKPFPSTTPTLPNTNPPKPPFPKLTNPVHQQSNPPPRPPSSTTSKLPIRRLSPTQIQER
jgi:hypothetical protein